MGWIIGPWFLSIFVNMIPWESGEICVARVRSCLKTLNNRSLWFSVSRTSLKSYFSKISTFLLPPLIVSYSSLGCASV